MLNDKEIIKIKEKYPTGTRIKLDHMDDPYHPVDDNTMGTVDHVDDAGQIHVSWDNGRSLAVVPEVDDFIIIEDMQEEKQIKVVIVEAGKHPIIDYIGNDLKSMQEVVGGYIEEVMLDDEAVLICNEEGKLRGLKPNRRVGNDIIAGTFFIAGDKGYEYLVSLNDKQAEKYVQDFHEIEEHTQDEVLENTVMKIFGGYQ